MLVSQSIANVRSPVFHPVKVLYSSEQPLQAHIHSYYELLFIEEGEGWLYLDGLKVHVVPGDLFLIAPGEIHDSNGLANTKNWTINFIDTTRLVAPQLQKAPSSSPPLLQKVFDYIKSNYARQISLCDVAKIVGRSPAYLTDLVRRETGKTILNWIIEYRLTEAQFLLLTTNHSIRRIAESVGYLDTGHFIRQFQRMYGMTPQAWRQTQPFSIAKTS